MLAVHVLDKVLCQIRLGVPDEKVAVEKRKRALNPMWRNSVPKLDFCGGKQLISFMITPKNALIEALARLEANQPGHKVTMPARIQHQVENLDEWCAKQGVDYSIDSRFLSIWRNP